MSWISRLFGRRRPQEPWFKIQAELDCKWRVAAWVYAARAEKLLAGAIWYEEPGGYDAHALAYVEAGGRRVYLDIDSRGRARPTSWRERSDGSDGLYFDSGTLGVPIRMV